MGRESHGDEAEMKAPLLLAALVLLSSCDRRAINPDVADGMTNERVDTLVERLNELEGRVEALEADR